VLGIGLSASTLSRAKRVACREVRTGTDCRIRGPTWRRSAWSIRDRAISLIVDVRLSVAWCWFWIGAEGGRLGVVVM